MVRIAVVGAAGRMGRRIIELAQETEGLAVVAALETAGHGALGEATAAAGVAVGADCSVDFDVLVEFALPGATGRSLAMAKAASAAALIGTTGHDRGQLEAIGHAGESIAVLKAANTSVGINLLLKLAPQVAQALGVDYDIELVESHHRFKVDAPSGTAVALLEAICEATGRDPEADAVHGRHGQTGQRPAGQIGVHALRLGDVVGQHEVHFSCLGERITLGHTAHTRDTFVRGALRAAAWLAGKRAGQYSMQDVLFGGS